MVEDGAKPEWTPRDGIGRNDRSRKRKPKVKQENPEEIHVFHLFLEYVAAHREEIITKPGTQGNNSAAVF